MQGLRAEPKPMLVEQKSSGLYPEDRIYEKNEYRGLTSDIRVYNFLDNNSYQAGLRVWLASQGLDTSYVPLIRPPQALETFKAGLAGETLPELKHSNFTFFLSRMKDETPLRESREPDSFAERRLAYYLGQAASLSRKTHH